MNKLRILDLFSGIGGFSLGLERTGGFETVAFCEIEPFPRKVLAKHWPETYCHDDVRTLNKDALCNGFVESAVLNRLCKEMGGNLQSVRFAIETISANVGKRTPTSTTNGPRSAAKASSITTAASALVAESENTHFWQLITSITTDQKNAQNTKEPLGKSLSSADCQTIIRFFATIATQQRLTTVPAHISNSLVNDEDVRSLTAGALRRDGIAVDVITGGFPCQDISTAGKQAGMGEGTRSGLWSEIVRLIGELRPQYVIVENVANLLSGPSERRGGWFGRVLGDLAECGYDAEWRNIPAWLVGRPHGRERVWLVAYPRQERRPGILPSFTSEREAKEFGANQAAIALAASRRLDAVAAGRLDGQSPFLDGPYGLPDLVGGLGSAGNAVIPQIPELIGRAILAAGAGT